LTKINKFRTMAKMVCQYPAGNVCRIRQMIRLLVGVRTSFAAISRVTEPLTGSLGQSWIEELSPLERVCVDTAFPEIREDLPAFLNCLKLQGIGVEVGVQTGAHAGNLLQTWQGEKMLLVDRWESVSDKTYVDIANTGSDEMNILRQKAEARLQQFGARAEIHRKWSEEAALDVANNSLDFVYLDARHDFKGVLSDIKAWWPKLRISGVFAGHDFWDGETPEGDFFVKSAVRAFFGSDAEPLTTQEKDRYQSFLFIKTSALDVAQRDTGPEFDPYRAGSKYFKLYQLAVEAAPHDASALAQIFRKSCLSQCYGDCSERLEKLVAKSLQFTEAAKSDDNVKATSEGVCSGPIKAGNCQGSTSNVSSKEPVDSVRYLGVCHNRCQITCEQRRQLFGTMLP
jgi:hypothetical protein